MFTRIGPNSIESSDGYTVEIMGRGLLVYTERGSQYACDIEISVVPQQILLYEKSLRKLNESEQIEEGNRRAIVQNIVQAFESQGTRIVQ